MSSFSECRSFDQSRENEKKPEVMQRAHPVRQPSSLSQVAFDFAHAEAWVSGFLLALFGLLFQFVLLVLTSAFALLIPVGWHGEKMLHAVGLWRAFFQLPGHCGDLSGATTTSSASQQAQLLTTVLSALITIHPIRLGRRSTACLWSTQEQ